MVGGEDGGGFLRIDGGFVEVFGEEVFGLECFFAAAEEVAEERVEVRVAPEGVALFLREGVLEGFDVFEREFVEVGEGEAGVEVEVCPGGG